MPPASARRAWPVIVRPDRLLAVVLTVTLAGCGLPVERRAPGSSDGGAAAADPGPALVLVTLDGARVEEMFGGLDVEALRSTLRPGRRLERASAARRYGAATPEARRERLMPFFWGTLMREHGSVAGNRAHGSVVRLANRHRFSYPGYAEMLLGVAHDEAIATNEPVRLPAMTALEFIRHGRGLPSASVAVFASWGVFSTIAEQTTGTLTINAGHAPALFAPPDPLLGASRHLPISVDDVVRADRLTFRFAIDHLRLHRPRVLHLALGDLDEHGHAGDYEGVLDAMAEADGYLRTLWTWLESQDDYRGRTSLLITTDHGRGRTADDWRHHGDEYPGAEDVWMAFVSPRMAARGEWRHHAPLTLAQAAATMVEWMDLDWRAFNPSAAPPVGETLLSTDAAPGPVAAAPASPR